MTKKQAFHNFKVDHMTLLVDPAFYNVSCVLMRIIFGAQSGDVLYNKTKEWVPGEGERSMTYAVQIGENPQEDVALDRTIVAIVQPTEPKTQSSHVRQMLQEHSAAAHWQHIALRTPDLLSFHKFAVERGVNFVTPVLHDDIEDLIQIFSGEWFFPGMKSSAMFFEFVQRNPNSASLKMLEEHNRESWFRDKTFMGLYQIKEAEYQSGDVKPFIDFELYEAIYEKLKDKEAFEITDQDFDEIEEMMLAYAAQKDKVSA